MLEELPAPEALPPRLPSTTLALSASVGAREEQVSEAPEQPFALRWDGIAGVLSLAAMGASGALAVSKSNSSSQALGEVLAVGGASAILVALVGMLVIAVRFAVLRLRAR